MTLKTVNSSKGITDISIDRLVSEVYNIKPNKTTEGETLTTLLQEALQEVKTLSVEDQNAVAKQMMETITSLADERLWQKSFADSQHMLAEMGAAALTRHKAGQSKRLP